MFHHLGNRDIEHFTILAMWKLCDVWLGMKTPPAAGGSLLVEEFTSAHLDTR